MKAGLLAIALVACEPEVKPPPQEAPQRPAPAVSLIPVELVEVPSEEPPDRLLASYTTYFKSGPEQANRVSNIQKLAEALSGTVLEYRDVFSFNEASGPRTKERGFLEAPTYIFDEIQPGVGGGVCQVSSTLFAAALLADLEVLERHAHSRVSSYIGPGLDATVNYPELCQDSETYDPRVCFDLRLQNVHPGSKLTLKFHVGDEVDGKRALEVSVFGQGNPPKIKTHWRTFSLPDYDTRYQEVAWWSSDRKKLKQRGKPGMKGRLSVRETRGEEVFVNYFYSDYPPVPEIWEVGKGWNDAKPEREGLPETGAERSAQQALGGEREQHP